MTVATVLTLLGLLIAALNALIGLRNLKLFDRLPRLDELSDDARQAAAAARVAVCIPARNEEANIERCVRAALAAGNQHTRVIVYDDGSTDNTAAILERLSNDDHRIVVADRRELPSGWNGKQHGCYRCAHTAFGIDESGELIPEQTLSASGHTPATHCLFIDADVTLEPGSIERAASGFYERDVRARSGGVAGAAGFGVLSTFPRQRTGTLPEALIVPLIFFLLLSYLPFKRMRTTLAPAASAGCGQFLLVSREAYAAFGGHAAFKATMHDGIKMPRAARRAGYHTDVLDGSDAAHVRMYRGFDETWRGFTKNAYEGLGSLALLVFTTVLNIVGHVLPPLFLIMLVLDSAATDRGIQFAPFLFAAAATIIPIAQRVLIADALSHAARGALLHPLGVTLMLAIQWRSWYLHVTGKRAWRGRTASDVGAGGAATA